MSKEAMKRVLKTLEGMNHADSIFAGEFDGEVAALREALNKEALHKLAAESLKEGLCLDDWAKIGCVNHDCNKCKALAEQPAQQELVACKTLCELCVKRGYIFCTNAAQTTLIPSPPAQPNFWEGYVPEPVGAVGSSIKSESPLGCNGPTGPVQQEPFGYFRYDLRLDAWVQNRAGIQGTPFYTSPPAQRTWQGLTDEEIDMLEELYAPPVHPDFVSDADHCFSLIKKVEAKLKEKNNG